MVLVVQNGWKVNGKYFKPFALEEIEIEFGF